MFSVELKFTIDCLKSLFQKNHEISEIDLDQKLEFIRKNPVKKIVFAAFEIFQLIQESKMDG